MENESYNRTGEWIKVHFDDLVQENSHTVTEEKNEVFVLAIIEELLEMIHYDYLKKSTSVPKIDDYQSEKASGESEDIETKVEKLIYEFFGNIYANEPKQVELAEKQYGHLGETDFIPQNYDSERKELSDSDDIESKINKIFYEFFGDIDGKHHKHLEKADLDPERAENSREKPGNEQEDDDQTEKNYFETKLNKLSDEFSDSNDGNDDQSEDNESIPSKISHSIRYSSWHHRFQCQHFSKTGDCYLNGCHFNHAPIIMIFGRKISPYYKLLRCEDYHNKGFCPAGYQCNDIHFETYEELHSVSTPRAILGRAEMLLR